MRQTVNPPRHIFTVGETVEFILDAPETAGRSGKAVVRSNLGRVAVHWEEVLEARNGETVAGMDWHDLEMRRDRSGRFTLKLPICEEESEREENIAD